MILMIIFASIFLISFLILFVVPDDKIDFIGEIIAYVCFFVDSSLLFLSLILIINANCYNKHHKEWEAEYKSLNARIYYWDTHLDDEDETLWDDVEAYNNKLTEAKRLASSPWTNILNEKACYDFETFELRERRRGLE